MKFSIGMVFVFVFVLITNNAFSQSEADLLGFQNMIKNIKLPIKKSENVSIVDIFMDGQKLTYVSVFSNKLAKATGNLSEAEIRKAFSSQIKEICLGTLDIRKQYNWLDVVHLHIDKSKKLLFKINSRDDCKKFDVPNSMTQNADEVIEKLKSMKLKMKLPADNGKGIALVDVYLDKNQIVTYQFVLADYFIEKLGNQLSIFIKSYTKGACSDKQRVLMKKLWDPFFVAEELLDKSGNQVTKFVLNEVCN